MGRASGGRCAPHVPDGAGSGPIGGLGPALDSLWAPLGRRAGCWFQDDCCRVGRSALTTATAAGRFTPLDTRWRGSQPRHDRGARRGAHVKGGYRTAGCQRASTVRRAWLTTAPLVLLTLLLTVGCGGLSDSVAGVSVFHPVWMPDGWVYYLREVASEGAELWKQRDDQDGDQPVLDLEDVEGICDGAALAFLFRATDEDLGI